ncbi:hypothetical protein HK100_001927 [Physocladia obscura]|uniref:Uncharacterized protein n=1 Tax=Physocladia obscura TaxID=109957 RepID=A0AAD5SWF2_9FUNG|nr:hypothetical protein HK100_001927 [Physocladia obscura]
MNLSISSSPLSFLDAGVDFWATVASVIRLRFQPPASTIPGAITLSQIAKQFIVSYWENLITQHLQKAPQTFASLTFTATQAVESAIPSAVASALETLTAEISATATAETIHWLPLIPPGVQQIRDIVESIVVKTGVASIAARNAFGLLENADGQLKGFVDGLTNVSTGIQKITETVYVTPNGIHFKMRATVAANLTARISSPLNNGTISATTIRDEIEAVQTNGISALVNNGSGLLHDLGARASTAAADFNSTAGQNFAALVLGSLNTAVTQNVNRAVNLTHAKAEEVGKALQAVNATVLGDYDANVLRWENVRAPLVLSVLVFGTVVFGAVVLPELAVVTFLVLVMAAIFFAVAVGVGEACIAINDPNTVFINAFSTTVGIDMQNFMNARNNCLNQTNTHSNNNGGLINFIQDLKILNNESSKYLSFSTKADEIVRGLNFSDFLNLYFSETIPSAIRPTQINSTLSSLNILSNFLNVSETRLSPPLPAKTASTVVGDLNLTAISNALAETETFLDTLVAQQQQNPTELFVVVASLRGNSNNSIAGIDSATVQKFLDDLNGCKTAIEKARRLTGEVVIDDAGESVRLLEKNVSTIQNDLQALQTTVFFVQNLVDQMKANITHRTPIIKNELYVAVSNMSDILDKSLACKPIVYDTIALQNEVCQKLSNALDALWLSFAVIGFTLFGVLCTVPYFMRHMPVPRGVASAAGGSWRRRGCGCCWKRKVAIRESQIKTENRSSDTIVNTSKSLVLDDSGGGGGGKCGHVGKNCGQAQEANHDVTSLRNNQQQSKQQLQHRKKLQHKQMQEIDCAPVTTGKSYRDSSSNREIRSICAVAGADGGVMARDSDWTLTSDGGVENVVAMTTWNDTDQQHHENKEKKTTAPQLSLSSSLSAGTIKQQHQQHQKQKQSLLVVVSPRLTQQQNQQLPLEPPSPPPSSPNPSAPPLSLLQPPRYSHGWV